MKNSIETSISDDITLLEKKEHVDHMALSRHNDTMSVLWDTSTHTAVPSDTVIDMSRNGYLKSLLESLPPPPSIERNEGDTFPIIVRCTVLF